MMVMGDEVQKTHSGNNNWYGHDSAMTQMDWSPLADASSPQAGFHRFCSELLKFRSGHPALGTESFVGSGDLVWHESNWDDPESRFLAFTLKGKGGGPDIYAAFNAHHFEVGVLGRQAGRRHSAGTRSFVSFTPPLPPCTQPQVKVSLPSPPNGQKWCRVVDTNLPSPKDFTPGGNGGVDPTYGVQGFSSVMLVAKQQ
jgi:isoamylase